MVAAARHAESLSAKAARLRNAMEQSDTGPLVVAGEIGDLVNSWEQYEQEATGLDVNEWLRRTFGAGRGLPFWERRRKAVEVLGEAIRRTVHHDVAVWILNSIPAAKHQEAKMLVMRARKENHDVPITPMMARYLLTEKLGLRPRQKRCGKCDDLECRILRLEAQVRDLGVEPVE